MTATCYHHGWLCMWDGKTWRYADTGEPSNLPRPCARCGRMPTPEGYDACLGYIPGALAACCGHGVQEPYVMRQLGVRP